MQQIKPKMPFVSVIMPVRNEADFIERSLKCILDQTYSHELMEIIVADGQSSDATCFLIEKIRKDSDFSIKVLENPERIAPTGLNRAIAQAKGEIIVRIDGHCEIEPDYVSNCVKYLIAGKADGVGGSIETVGETWRAKAIAVAMSSNFGVGGSAFRCVKDREMYVDTVAFPGYKREILEKAGAFDEELVRNQDDEFNYRIRKLGGRILLASDIHSRYYSRSNFKCLWRQYFQYGYWKVRVLQLHPKQMSLRQFIPFVFVSTLIILFFFSLFFDFGKWILAAILGFYFLTAGAATLKSVDRIRFFALPFVFFSFGILHFSYGTGFLTGLFVFRHRWSKAKTMARKTTF